MFICSDEREEKGNVRYSDSPLIKKKEGVDVHRHVLWPPCLLMEFSESYDFRLVFYKSDSLRKLFVPLPFSQNILETALHTHNMANQFHSELNFLK